VHIIVFVFLHYPNIPHRRKRCSFNELYSVLISHFEQVVNKIKYPSGQNTCSKSEKYNQNNPTLNSFCSPRFRSNGKGKRKRVTNLHRENLFKVRKIKVGRHCSNIIFLTLNRLLSTVAYLWCKREYISSCSV